jgi:hypothetical protein
MKIKPTSLKLLASVMEGVVTAMLITNIAMHNPIVSIAVFIIVYLANIEQHTKDMSKKDIFDSTLASWIIVFGMFVIVTIAPKDFLMFVATICFSVMHALIRYMSAELHPFELAFFRNIFGLLVVIPWFMRYGLKPLKTKLL